MTQNSKYDLEERTLKFAKRVNSYVNNLPKTLSNIENGKQLIRSAGSVSRKDFVMRAKICRKEAKESRYWLILTEPRGSDLVEKDSLVREAGELTKIFGSIVEKSK